MVPTNTSLTEKMLPIYTMSMKTTTRQITTSPVAGMVPFFMSERFWNKRKLRNPSENMISSLSYIFARIQIVKTLYPRFTPCQTNAHINAKRWVLMRYLSKQYPKIHDLRTKKHNYGVSNYKYSNINTIIF